MSCTPYAILLDTISYLSFLLTLILLYINIDSALGKTDIQSRGGQICRQMFRSFNAPTSAACRLDHPRLAWTDKYVYR